MTDVWQMYSEALMKLGRDKEALAALQRPRGSLPASPQIMMALSDYYLEIGNFAEARRHAEAVGDAGTASPHENLARIALAEGDLDAAEREARGRARAVPGAPRPAADPRTGPPRPRRLRRRAGRARIARRGRAPPSTVPLQNLQYLRGDCLARLGPSPEAEAAFRRRSGISRATPRRAPRSRCSTRARGARPRRARRSPTSCSSCGRPRPTSPRAGRTRCSAIPRAPARFGREAKRLFPKRQGAQERAGRQADGSGPGGDPQVCAPSSPAAPRSLEPEDRRRDVGERAARRRGARPFAHEDQNGTGLVVCAVCGSPVTGSIICSALPWSAVISEDRARLAAGGFEDPEAAVERLDRGDRLGELARVADHVGVREVDDVGAEAAVAAGRATASSVISAALICGWRS